MSTDCAPTSDNLEKEFDLNVVIDLTVDENVSRRAVPDFRRLRGHIYKGFKWSDEERLWKCTLCPTALPHHLKYGTSTLNRHFQEKHPQALKELQNKIEEKDDKQTTLTSHLISKKSAPLPVTKEGVRARLAKLIVGADIPYSIVDNPLLEDFVSYVSREKSNVVPLPSRPTVKADIDKMYEAGKQELILELSNNDGKVSLIVDCWTSSNQNSYQGVVATWVDNKWRMQGCLLDLTILDGSHTGTNLANAMNDVITEFKLWNKVMAITTDNATNMDTMLEQLDQHAFENQSDFTSINFRVRCLAHIINLACKELLKKAESVFEDRYRLLSEEMSEDNSWPMGKGVIKKLRSGIRAIRASPQRLKSYENACVKEGLKHRALLRDVQTRWNSTYDMLVRVKEMKPAYERTCSISDLQQYKMTADEWIFQDYLIEILQPFKEMTILISKDRPTLSDTCGAYHILFNHREKYSENVMPLKEGPSSSKRTRRHESAESYPDWMKSCADAAWAKLQEYYPSSDALVYLVATVMDPRFKLDWYKAIEWPQEWQKVAKGSVTKYWKQTYQPKDTTEVNETPGSQQCTNVSQVSIRGHMFEDLYEQRMKSFHKSEDELKQYLCEPVVKPSTISNIGVLGWWERNAPRFPNLSRMAKDVLSVHGTRVSVERFFSSGPDLLSAKRQRLTAASVKEFLSLKAWIKQKSSAESTKLFQQLRISKSLGDEDFGEDG